MTSIVTMRWADGRAAPRRLRVLSNGWTDVRVWFRDWFPRHGWKPDTRPMIVEFRSAGDWSEASLYVGVTR